MPSGQPPQGSAATPAALRPPFAPATRGVVIASYVLMGAALLLVMLRGLLPGLLCVCLGFLLTRWLAPRLAWFPSRTANSMATRGQTAAATLVMLSPLLLLALALSHSRTYIVDAPQQYRELLDFLARTVLELRLKLPTDIAAQLPEGAAEIQRTIAAYLAAKAGALAMAGRAWLTGLLYAYVGLLIGALAAVRSVGASRGPLAQELVLPLWDLDLPYTPALITLTFVAGLVPIVGNLLCNAVITLVGLSVSPVAAVACLAFLILIHKAEYVINAKVVGRRTHMGVWELLSVMFVAEAVFGPAGLVAAPLFYAYLKKELEAARLV